MSLPPLTPPSRRRGLQNDSLLYFDTPPYASPTTRRHLGFATKMPDEHFYKSIMNKCVFAWLSSRQARLIFVFACKVTNNYSIRQKILHLFSSYFSMFFLFLYVSRHYPLHLHFLTISMGGKCFARARCCARVRCYARVRCCAR